MSVVAELEPKEVFKWFDKLSEIPRGSGQEQRISDWFVRFAEERGYEVKQDELFNIYIKAPGTVGYENSPTIIFHGHMDMVCKKDAGVEHDFLNDGLDLRVDQDGWIRANGTTLGADNGIGLSYFLAVLDNREIPHPPIECAFTVMEEMGKVGGDGFNVNWLTGKRMIDMNWDKDEKLLAGCGGDVSVKFNVKIESEDKKTEARLYDLEISNLIGGHCEFDIVRERGNSIKLLARLLNNIIDGTQSVRVATVSGGVQNNVIPSEASAVLEVLDEELELVTAIINKTTDEIREEYSVTDPEIRIAYTESEKTFEKVFTREMAKKLIKSLLLIPNGVISMSYKVPGISECSNNIGIMRTENDWVTAISTITSLVTTRKHEVVKQIIALAELAGDGVTAEQFGTDAPEWIFNPDSYLLKKAVSAYEKQIGEKPEVYAMPASLELGLFQERIKGLDIIAIGTSTNGVHSPKEELEVKSVGKAWKIFKYLLASLKD
jgi:dipeptidase D